MYSYRFGSQQEKLCASPANTHTRAERRHLQCVGVWQLYRYVQHAVWQTEATLFTEQTEEEKATHKKLKKRNPCRLSGWRQLELFFHSSLSFFQPVSPYPHYLPRAHFQKATPTETLAHTCNYCFQHTQITSRSKHQLSAKLWINEQIQALINRQVKMWEQTGSSSESINHIWSTHLCILCIITS